MGKLFKKSKPTQASYFLSESQRKHTSRLSFIYGSPKLVALISIIVVASLVSGIVIVQKQNSSKAATAEWSISSHDGFGANMKDGAFWQFDKEGITVNASNNAGENLKIAFPANSTSERGRHACWRLAIPGDVTVTSVNFKVTSNAAGSTMVNVQRNDTVVASNDRAINNGSLEANVAPSAGGVVQVCHKIAGNPGEQRAFEQERFMYVNDYVVHGYKTVADQPQATQFGVSGRIVTQGDNPRGVANVQISNCQTFPAATTNENGDFGFYVAPGSGYCVRPQGWDYNTYSIVATNANDGWGFVNNESDPSGNSRSYEGKVAVNGNLNGRANYDFVLKPVKSSATTPSPTPSPTPSSQPTAGTTVIDENRFKAWGFPEPTNPSTNKGIPHGNGDKLYVTYNQGTNYPDGLTACWTTVINTGNTATDFKLNIDSNHAGRNTIILRATGNADKEIGRNLGRHDEIWKLDNPVQAGGTISVCNKVNNPGNKEAFEADRTFTVHSYQIYGTGTKVTDATKPQVRITNPENGKTVAGTITLRAEASDSSGIKYVEFKRGGEILGGQLTSAPYEYKLDTSKLPSGKIELQALAQDNAGNFNSSNEITLNIQNSKPESPPKPATPSTAPKPAPSTEPKIDTGPTSCSGNSIVEAENGVRKNVTGIANDPLFPDVKAVVLFSNNSYVECVIEAPKTARYAFGAKIRSADLGGIAKARIAMAGAGNVASREVQAPKDQVYGIVRFNEVADYRQLQAGQKVTVRVTFTNDARNNKGGDRNLWVDNLMLVEIPQAAEAGASSNKPEGDSAIVPCNQSSRAEAEEASLFQGASIKTDVAAPGSKSVVRLATNAQYIQCTLRAPADGRYIVGAVAKSDHRPLQDKAIVKLAMSGNNKGVNEDTQPTVGVYDRIRMRANEDTVRTMKAGEQVVVRISVTNASNNPVTRKHLLVDSFELILVPNAAPPQRTPADPAKETVSIPVVEGEKNIEEVGYSNATGAVYIKVEAERASYKGTQFPEAPAQNASNNAAVKLWSNKNYVEYDINFPATDTYSLDFAGRSENFNGTAEARLVLDGKKLFGDDIKLQSSPKHNYYTSEKKVRIEKGRHTFRIEFTNDKRNSDGGDRNLLIDFLQVRGTKRLSPITSPKPTPSSPSVVEKLDPNTQTVEAENGSWCRATQERIGCEQLAIPDSTAYGSRALVLNRKTDFVEVQFTTGPTGTYSIGATLKSIDYKGSAKADIFVDNDLVANDVTPSSQSFRPFMYSKKFSANSKHRIRVVFINDLCGQKPNQCTPSNDRNLLVDQLRLTLISALTPTNNQTSSTPDTSPIPLWARSTKNNVLATEWHCTPPPVAEYGNFYCPDSAKPESQKHVGVMLFSYPANGGRTSQAMLYIPKGMIDEYQTGKKVESRPLVFYLHGRGFANLTNGNTEVSPSGINLPNENRTGWWKENEDSGKLDAAYNTANDPRYGGAILVAPFGQGRVIDGRDWGYPPNIDDFAKLPQYLQEMLPYLNIDKSRIYTMGSSMGGHDSLQFVTLYPQLIAAAYSNDGVSDWALRYKQAVSTPTEPKSFGNDPAAVAGLKLTIPLETGGTPENNPQAYRERSPLYNLNERTANQPIKIEVDMQDSLVSPTQSIIFYEKLKRLNPSAPELRKNPNLGHSAALPPHGANRNEGEPRLYLRPMEFFFNNGDWLRN